MGWSDNNTVNVTSSLYAPDASIAVAQGETAITGGATFVRGNKPTIGADCYYSETLGSAQGTKTYVFDVDPGFLGETVGASDLATYYANGILYDDKYYVAPIISLADNADNSAVINAANGYVADVTLADRTLYKDGKWNTLCLPFSVTLSGSVLDGAIARPLTAASIDGSTLNLTFGDAVTELVAGTPYIIKWTKASDYVDDEAHNLVNPVFSGVTIDNTTRNCVFGSGATQVGFIGTYSNQTFDAEDKNILFMGGENKLYYPQNGASIGAQRAYFKIGIGDAEAPAFIASFNIDFGDGETTGIISVHDSGFMVNGYDAWYTLDGRKLSGRSAEGRLQGKKPTRAGVYINKGKAVVIK